MSADPTCYTQHTITCKPQKNQKDCALSHTPAAIQTNKLGSTRGARPHSRLPFMLARAHESLQRRSMTVQDHVENKKLLAGSAKPSNRAHLTSTLCRSTAVPSGKAFCSRSLRQADKLPSQTFRLQNPDGVREQTVLTQCQQKPQPALCYKHLESLTSTCLRTVHAPSLDLRHMPCLPPTPGPRSLHGSCRAAWSSVRRANPGAEPIRSPPQHQ